jgi:hypothetical protein
LSSAHRTPGVLDPEAKLATALLHVAREYGFAGWRALKAQIEGHRAKKIANPVMRFLAVAGIDRSIAFYRDVLMMDPDALPSC